MSSQETQTEAEQTPNFPVDFRNRVKVDVANACKGGADSEVVKRIVADMAEQEVERRANALMACYNEWERLTKQLPKLQKPDNTAMIPTGDGSGDVEVVHSFSSEAWKKINDHNTKIEKVEQAINEAVRDVKFDKAFEMAKKAGN